MRLRIAVVGLLAVVLLPLGAAAHPGPAEPPMFGSPECITVVDKQVMPRLYVPYGLAFDDVEPEVDKITLPDSKTHQFFAFRGSVIVMLPEYEFWPASPSEHSILPLWINHDDLQRADAANGPTIAPDFRAADIGQDVLHVRPELAGQWLEVSATPARRPITVIQAMLGVYWDLTNVTAGVYQIVSYIFSPPYNAWEPRPGLIKVVDGANNPPAVALEPIDDILYAGQGRRLSGCLDTPAGSTLSSWYRFEGSSEWKPWLREHPVSTGPLDLCFVNPDPSVSGMVRLRVAVRAPDGSETFAFSPDVLVQVNTAQPCVASASRCCEVTGRTQPDSPPTAATPDPMQAPPVTAMPQPAAASVPAPAATVSEAGCSTGGGGDASVLAQLAVLLTLCARRRRSE
jgi:hypothetical protein